jgi:hypothetical protein
MMATDVTVADLIQSRRHIVDQNTVVFLGPQGRQPAQVVSQLAPSMRGSKVLQSTGQGQIMVGVEDVKCHQFRQFVGKGTTFFCFMSPV